MRKSNQIRLEPKTLDELDLMATKTYQSPKAFLEKLISAISDLVHSYDWCNVVIEPSIREKEAIVVKVVSGKRQIAVGLASSETEAWQKGKTELGLKGED